jgi:amidase
MVGVAEFQGDARRSIAGMRVAYSPDLGGIPVDRRVAAVVEDAVNDLGAAGATVDRVALTLPRDQLELAETWLQSARTEVYDMLQGVFADHDLLVTPAVGCLPVENTGAPGEVPLPEAIEGVAVDGAIGWTLTYPANFTGHPAASVPAGQVDGLPVGMQITGRSGADGDVLAAAGAMERMRPWSETYAVPAERSLT